jgi:hypothetical protein
MIMKKIKLFTLLLMFALCTTTLLTSCKRDDTTFTFINSRNLAEGTTVTLFEYTDNNAKVGYHELGKDIPLGFREVFKANPKATNVRVQLVWESGGVVFIRWIDLFFFLQVAKNTNIEIKDNMPLEEKEPIIPRP